MTTSRRGALAHPVLHAVGHGVVVRRGCARARTCASDATEANAILAYAVGSVALALLLRKPCGGRSLRGSARDCSRSWRWSRSRTGTASAARSLHTAGRCGRSRGSCTGDCCTQRTACARRPCTASRSRPPCASGTRPRPSRSSRGSRGRPASGWAGCFLPVPCGSRARPPFPRSSIFSRSPPRARRPGGPCATIADAYARTAGTTIAALLGAWFCIVNVISPGSAAPLPYAPIVNPLDLTLILALTALFVWAHRTQQVAERTLYAWFGVAVFVFVNAIVFRSVHQWLGVPWRFNALLASKPLQAALTLTWTATALPIMLMATRRAIRPLWMTGAALAGGRRRQAVRARSRVIGRIAARGRLPRRWRAASPDRLPRAAAAGEGCPSAVMDVREQLAAWTRDGALPPENVHAALRIAGVTPAPLQWRTFVERMLVWMGAVLVRRRRRLLHRGELAGARSLRQVRARRGGARGGDRRRVVARSRRRGGTCSALRGRDGHGRAARARRPGLPDGCGHVRALRGVGRVHRSMGGGRAPTRAVDARRRARRHRHGHVLPHRTSHEASTGST